MKTLLRLIENLKYSEIAPDKWYVYGLTYNKNEKIITFFVDTGNDRNVHFRIEKVNKYYFLSIENSLEYINANSPYEIFGVIIENLLSDVFWVKELMEIIKD